MAATTMNPKPIQTLRSSNSAGPSEMTDFSRRMAQRDREFIVYDDGWRGCSYLTTLKPLHFMHNDMCPAVPVSVIKGHRFNKFAFALISHIRGSG